MEIVCIPDRLSYFPNLEISKIWYWLFHFPTMEISKIQEWKCNFPNMETILILEWIFYLPSLENGNNILFWIIYYPKLYFLLILSWILQFPFFFQSWLYECARLGICLNPHWIFLDKPNLGKLHFLQTWFFLENQEISRRKPSKNWIGFFTFFPVSWFAEIIAFLCIASNVWICRSRSKSGPPGVTWT